MIQKSKKKRVKLGRLVLEVPADDSQFKKDGLLVPLSLEEDKNDRAPLDFTSISSREVGRQHSAWSVRHAHLMFLIGNLRAEVGNTKHQLKNAEAAWLVRHEGEYKSKWEAEYAMGRRSKRVKRFRVRLRKAEAGLTRAEALAESYKALREAASREIARRVDERASRD